MLKLMGKKILTFLHLNFLLILNCGLIFNHAKDISCDQCPAMFNTQQGLKDHQRRHRKDYSHFCELCAKGFYTVSALDNHRRMHTGEKPYSCSLCEYSCSIKGNLAKHMKVHGKQTSGLQQ